MNFLRIGNAFLSALLACLLAGCGGGGDQGRQPILGLSPAVLTSVTVAPAQSSIAIGASQALTATAVYSDGAARDVSASASWTSSAAAVASVNSSGLVVGVAAGSSTVSASFEGKSASSAITVTPASIVSLSLSPANATVHLGARVQYTVNANFTDGVTRDVTANSLIASSAPNIAIAYLGDAAQGIAAGSTTISAYSGNATGSTSLTVSPSALTSLAITPANPSLPAGTTRQLVVTGTYADGASADLTAAVTFSSSAAGVATVSAVGILNGVTTGSAVITANYGNVSSTTTVTVTPAVLNFVNIIPTTPGLLVGATMSLMAKGIYSDGSTADLSAGAAWVSANTNVATVVPGGQVTGVAPGTSQISVVSGGKTNVVTITVTAPPAATALNLGAAANFALLAGTAINNSSSLLFPGLITGDVGSPLQSQAPLQAAGFLNLSSGAALTGALSDMQLAVNDARARPCAMTVLQAVDLAAQTLVPGVYCFDSPVAINGNLNLSGAGVYIFITPALTLSASGNVMLNGGASAAQVFWVASGPVLLGAGSNFKGTLLAAPGPVTLGPQANVVNGRVLTSGTVIIDNNIITR